MLLLNSDIYCLPTLKDPGGNAILEAMSCGLPVISTNYGDRHIVLPKIVACLLIQYLSWTMYIDYLRR